MSLPKRNALGRGLDSLISMDDVPARGSSAINDIALENINVNPDQPRRTFDEEALGELADSIRQLGIIQPLSLRKTAPRQLSDHSRERRYRAALMAGCIRFRHIYVRPTMPNGPRWLSSRIYSART